MRIGLFLVITLVSLCTGPGAYANDFTYAAIAERFAETRIDSRDVQAAKMHGECLVGLKRLVFVKRSDFDPVAEWINFRAISLLEQFPPCNVLIMMQVARNELLKSVEQP